MAAYLFPERKSQPGSAERNAQPLADAVLPLLEVLAAKKQAPVHVLEVGSGEGVQLAALARTAASRRQDAVHAHGANDSPTKHNSSLALFQPTEADDASMHEVKRTCKDVEDVAACRRLQIENDDDWLALAGATRSESADSGRPSSAAKAPFDVVFVFNVIHIVPWQTVEALFAHLDPGQGILAPRNGRIIFYGAFNENGNFTSEGNAKFQDYLKGKDGRFGLRDLQQELTVLAEKYHLKLIERIEMPAGNLLAVFGTET